MTKHTIYQISLSEYCMRPFKMDPRNCDFSAARASIVGDINKCIQNASMVAIKDINILMAPDKADIKASVDDSGVREGRISLNFTVGDAVTIEYPVELSKVSLIEIKVTEDADLAIIRAK